MHLKPCWELAEDLLKEGDKYDLAKEVPAVERDILGRYIYRKPNLFSEPDCSIELYWRCIRTALDTDQRPARKLDMNRTRR
jgi:hypothetical protein